MNLSLLTEKLPIIALVVGALLIIWGYHSKILAWVSSWFLKLKPKSKTMSPTKRFDTFYALRSWCEKAGHFDAVRALDDNVLVAIVCDSCPCDPTSGVEDLDFLKDKP